MGLSATVDATGFESALGAYFRDQERRLEQAMLIATDRAGKKLKNSIRQSMAGAGLGKLGNAFAGKSDLERGGIQVRYPNGGFSAGATVYVRSGSDRTRGAIKAYTEGATIRPRRGRYLWIPTDEIQRLAGSKGDRQRVTPGNWTRLGLDARIGPLVPVKSVNGRPLLVVQDASVGALGQSRSARSRTKRGAVRKGYVAKSFTVCFIGIPATARAARIDLKALQVAAQAELQGLIAAALGKGS